MIFPIIFRTPQITKSWPALVVACLFAISCGEPASITLPRKAEDPAINVCSRWNKARENLSEGSWSGSVEHCVAGDMNKQWRERTLDYINTYRSLLGLSAVTTNPERNRMAQECALLLHANGRLSHTPDTSWACHSKDGQSAAGASNIATTPAMLGVDAFIVDHGNADTLGHRRWLFSNQLGPIGIGSTSDYSCIWVAEGRGKDHHKWIAWPPEGPVPLEVFKPRKSMNLDTMGWSLQSNGFCIGEAKVSVVSQGQQLPIITQRLKGSYGDWCAISIIPNGWASQANQSYTVTASNQTETIQYTIRVVDCEQIINENKTQ